MKLEEMDKATREEIIHEAGILIPAYQKFSTEHLINEVVMWIKGFVRVENGSKGEVTNSARSCYLASSDVLRERDFEKRNAVYQNMIMNLDILGFRICDLYGDAVILKKERFKNQVG